MTTHQLAFIPRVWKSQEYATCHSCGCSTITRRKWERQAKWGVRLARWQNSHAPFYVECDLRVDLEADGTPPRTGYATVTRAATGAAQEAA